MSQVRAVTDALLAAIKLIDGSLDGAYQYNHDLSSTGRIVQDCVLDPDLVPMVSLICESVGEDEGPELTGFTESATYLLFGFVNAPSDTSASRVGEAMDLLDDLRHALRKDRCLGGLVSRVTISGRAFSGDELELAPQFGMVYAIVSTEWMEDG